MATKRPWEGSWVIVSDLSAGGQGVTRLVRSAATPTRQGVLKTLKRPNADQDRRRMRQEVVNLGVVKAAGGRVPEVLEENTGQFADPHATLYFVMEFVEGKTLEQLVQEHGRMTVDMAMQIACDISATIAIGHGLTVVHRDLKPDNVIVADSGTQVATILDYGLSFNKEEGTALTEPQETFRNKFLMLAETNVIGGSRRDPRLDLTAVAGILYFCLTRHHPRLLRDEKNFPPHRRLGASIKEALGDDRHLPYLDAFFNRAFAADIGHRFSSVTEFVAALQDIRAFANRPPAEDPEKVAAEVSSDLRSNNRRVRLRLFAACAATVPKAITEYVSSVAGRLDMFTATLHHMGQPPLPPGIDDTEVFLNVVVAQSQHFTNQRMIQYRVGVVGDEARVLKRRKHLPLGDLKPFTDVDTEWLTVFAYFASDEPTTDAIIHDVKVELATAMRALKADMDD